MTLRVTMYGAAREVTGSCYKLETSETQLLVDCGLFQGPPRLERLNTIPSTLSVKNLHAVAITHGHLDHCGRLPQLVRAGFRGPIYATSGTIDISRLILKDAAKIQADETRRDNRRRIRKGYPPLEPLFTLEDVNKVLELFQQVEYDKSVKIGSGLSASFVEAGHILGSASIVFHLSKHEGNKSVVFSGDLGQWDTPILRDPARIDHADFVFMESTYGDRDHRSMDDTLAEFRQLLASAISSGGKILIPTFAVGRAQQVLYHLAQIFRTNLVPPCPIYLDSPMAISATEIYYKHVAEMDSEALDLIGSGQVHRDLSTLVNCITSEESMELNAVSGPCIIMAGAGMCNAGRIMHHLRHNLSNPNTIVLIVGYQPRGSLGRRLLEGAEEVKIHGRIIQVRATVRGLGGFSAHAGQSDLLRWLQPMAKGNPQVFLTHGEPGPIAQLSRQVKVKFGIEPSAPTFGQVIDLIT